MFHSHHLITKTAGALAALGLLGVATAGASAAGAQPTSATASAVPACRTADLSAKLGVIGAGAGQRYETLTLTNVSHHSCHTYGFVGMQFLGAHGHPLPTNVVRDRSRAPHRVLLAPGARATTQLHWGVIPGSSDPHGVCPAAPRRVEVTPPDERSHLTLAWKGGQVCEHGTVSVTRLI